MVADIRAAVDWAKANAPVDETRIYAIGVSGGGHATQLLAGRTPEIWAGISSWCGIADVAAWHAETTAAGRKNYAGHIEGAIGGAPGATDKTAAEAVHRSPLTWLAQAATVPLDLNHGIDDGRTGSVPFPIPSTPSTPSSRSLPASPRPRSPDGMPIPPRSRAIPV